MIMRRGILLQLAIGILAAMVFASQSAAQSSDVNFPTPLTSNTIDSTIKPRDIGDARLTTQYFAFTGGQGDVFVNVVTKNFDGDIDIFTAEGMRPLSKIVIYSDSTINETGRLIYLRKSEKLLLRIEGRPPDDRPATIRIKFAGSFVAMEGGSEANSDVPTVTTSQTGSVRVNSVGTILSIPEVKESQTEVPKTESVAITPKKEIAKSDAIKKEPSNSDAAKDKPVRVSKPGKPKVVVTEPFPAKENAEKTEKESPKSTTSTPKKPKPKATTKVEKTASPRENEKADALASVRLVIAFKNGDKLERPLSEVLRFSVDKGVLTVIAKDGGIRRYSMLDVAEVTIK